jgi:hypothetical protein
MQNTNCAKVLFSKELQRNRRQEQTCHDPQCRRKHRDWFEIDLNQAKRVMGTSGSRMDHAQPQDKAVLTSSEDIILS